MFFHFTAEGLLAFLNWVATPSRTTRRCWLGDFSREIRVTDRTRTRPSAARDLLDKWVETDEPTFRLLRLLHPESRMAVAMVDSRNRERQGRRSGSQAMVKSPWPSNAEDGVNRSLGNWTKCMLGHYPKDKREAFRALAESKKGDTRTVSQDETGSWTDHCVKACPAPISHRKSLRMQRKHFKRQIRTFGFQERVTR